MQTRTEYLGYRHWNRIRNSGDAITPLVLERISGLAARSSSPDMPHILGVGSIMFFANRHSHVWGSGILNPGMPAPDVLQSTFHAVRGTKTRDALRALGVDLPDIPLGDPGIFADELCEDIPQADREVRYRAAFVPHHGSLGHPTYQAIRDSDEFTLVDVLDDSLLPLQQILQSDVVISQSLHGLIYAESLGKPSVWISDRRDDIWRFKFEDWYSTAREPPREALPLDADLDEMVAAARLCQSEIDKEALAEALPVEAVRATSTPFMSFQSCRKYNPAVIFVESLLAGRRYEGEELTQSLIEALSRKIFPPIYRLFKTWAERSYCLVAPTDEALDLNPEKLAAVARYLDENTAVDFAFVAPRDTIESCGGRGFVLASGLAGFRDNPPAVGAIMVRPDSFQLSRNFATLGV
jgi:hypothetical protein